MKGHHGIRCVCVVALAMVLQVGAFTAAVAQAPDFPNGIGRYQKHARETGRMFVVKSESVTYCPKSREYRFEIKFADAPDYWTEDQHGRAFNYFQYHIRYDEHPGNYMSNRVMIWSREISSVDEIVIRDFHGGGGPGGWGAIRYTIPYDPGNKKLCFNVPAEVIGDYDGKIFYGLHTGHYGSSLGQFRYFRSNKGELPVDCYIRNSSLIRCNRGNGPLKAAMETEYTWGAIKSIYRQEE